MRDTKHFYFTKKGRRQSMCKDCHKAYYAAQAKDPMKRKEAQERHAAYYQKHKAWHRQYYIDKLKDPIEHAKQLERQRKWVKANKEYASEWARDWYAVNKDRVAPRRRAYDKTQWETNPKVRERKNKQKSESIARRASDPSFVQKRKSWERNGNHKRRIRMYRATQSTEKLTAEQWEAILDKYGRKCLACGRTDVKLTLDHIVPISKGGKHTADNAQPLCRPCNTHKGVKTTDYR